LVIGVVLMTVFNQFNNRQAAQNSVSTAAMEDAKQGKIAKAVVDGRTVRARLRMAGRCGLTRRAGHLDGR
jgi:cell division protease FtsH